MEEKKYIYRGSVDELRAEMECLQDDNPKGWQISGGARVGWREWPPRRVSTRATWIVGGAVGHAVMDAYQKKPGQTEVVFRDGCSLAPYTYRKRPDKPMGPAFEEVTQRFAKELKLTSIEGDAGKLRRPTVKTGGGFMFAEEKIRLETTPEMFAHWLQEHTKGVNNRPFSVKGGYLRLRQAYYRLVPGASSLTVTIDGYFIGEAEDGEITRLEPLLNDVITFRITRLNPEWIDVVARCYSSDVASYFQELLAAIEDLPISAQRPGMPTPPQVMPAGDGAGGEAILGEFLTTIKGVTMDLGTFGDFLARLRKDELTFERVGARRWQAKWYGCDTGYVVALPVGDELNLDFYLMKWDQDPKPVAYEEDNGEIIIEWEPNVWARIMVDRVRAGLQELGVLQGDAPTPARSYTPRVPERPADRRRWRTTWFKIKGEAEKGKPVAAIGDWLGKMHPHLACSTDTLSDIIRAGDAGLLDKLKLPKNP